MTEQNELTVSIRSLRAHNNDTEVAVGIVIENGGNREERSLLLTLEQYCELKPVKGVIDEETYDRLEEASRFCMALRCGENLLSYGFNPVKTLARKIARHGFSREISERAAEKLREMGLIDEDNDLQCEVERCLLKRWGQRRIQAHLWNRGFGQEALSGLPDLLEEVDFTANCTELIRRHYGGLPETPKEKQRMTASLERYGYCIDEIRGAFRQLQREERSKNPRADRIEESD